MLDNIAHTMQQAHNRRLDYTLEFILGVSAKYQERTAIILGSRKALEGIGREKIVLIVMDCRPVTIMTRRETQNFDKRQLQVKQIVYL